MKYVDSSGNEISESDVDLAKGTVTQTSVVTKYHDAVDGTPDVGYNRYRYVFFEDGTTFDAGEDDGQAQGEIALLVPGDTYRDKVVREVGTEFVLTKPGVQPSEAWDEYEDAMMYVPYTDEELAQMKEQEKAAEEAAKAEKALRESYDQLVSAVADLNELMAEMVGTDDGEAS